MRTPLPLLLIAAAIAAAATPPQPTAHAASLYTRAAEPRVAHVETRGDGPTTLVLIPGLSCDWTVWADFMDAHGDRYTMHAVTLPGFGGHEAPGIEDDAKGAPLMDHALEAIANHIRGMDGARPIVMGHSMGGALAYRLAIEHPNLIAGAIAVDAPPAIPLGPQALTEGERRRLIDEVIAPALRAQPASAWQAQQAAQIRAMVADEDRAAELIEMANKTPADIAVRYAIELYREDLRAELARVSRPVLAIAALHDDARDAGVDADTMRAVWDRQVGALEGVELVTILDARHFVMDDQPELFAEAVRRFAERVSN